MSPSEGSVLLLGIGEDLDRAIVHGLSELGHSTLTLLSGSGTAAAQPQRGAAGRHWSQCESNIDADALGRLKNFLHDQDRPLQAIVARFDVEADARATPADWSQRALSVALRAALQRVTAVLSQATHVPVIVAVRVPARSSRSWLLARLTKEMRKDELSFAQANIVAYLDEDAYPSVTEAIVFLCTAGRTVRGAVLPVDETGTLADLLWR